VIVVLFLKIPGMILAFFILTFISLIILLMGFFEIKLPFIDKVTRKNLEKIYMPNSAFRLRHKPAKTNVSRTKLPDRYNSYLIKGHRYSEHEPPRFA
jgi:hypothetical protein